LGPITTKPDFDYSVVLNYRHSNPDTYAERENASQYTILEF